jgi:hypothetical protein
MSQLERVTVNLIPIASDHLARGMELTGHSKTDFINRAIQAYSYLEEIRVNGGDVLIREDGEAEPSKIMFL